MAEEKRKFMRFAVPVSTRYKSPGRKIKGSSITRDISRKGMNILVTKELNVGVNLELELFIPNEIIPVFATGRVAWIKKIDSQPENRFSAGITIIKMSPFDINALLEYVYNYWKENTIRENA